MTGKIAFTTFDIQSGELLRTMFASDIHIVDLQCIDPQNPTAEPTISYVFGHWDRETHHVVAGEVQPKDPE